MTTDDLDARLEKVDRQIAELHNRLLRVEGELGITEISPEGIPTAGEIRHRPDPTEINPQEPGAAAN